MLNIYPCRYWLSHTLKTYGQFAIIFSRWSVTELHRIFVVWLRTNPMHRINIKLESGWNQLTSSFSLSTWQVTLTLLLLTHRVQGSAPIPVRWNWDPAKNRKHFIYTICPISFCPNSPYFAFRSIQDPLVHHGRHFHQEIGEEMIFLDIYYKHTSG